MEEDDTKISTELKEHYYQIVKKSVLSEKLLSIEKGVIITDNTYVVRYRAPFKRDIKSGEEENNLSVAKDKQELEQYFNVKLAGNIRDNQYEVFKIEYDSGSNVIIRIVIGYVSFKDNRILWAKVTDTDFTKTIQLLKDQMVTIQYHKLVTYQANITGEIKKPGFWRKLGSFIGLFKSNNPTIDLSGVKKKAEEMVANKNMANVYDCFGIDYFILCIYDSLVDIVSLRMFQIYDNDIVLMLTRLPSFVYYNITKSVNDVSNFIVGETFMDNTDFVYKFLRSRSDYCSWYNNYLYSSVYDWETYKNNFKLVRPHSKNRDDLDFLLFEYYSEKSLSLDELAAYFKLDPNVMFKIYLEKYFLDGRKVLADFFQNSTESQLSEYVTSNIHRYTNYLFNEYDMPNEYDKYFIFLVAYLYNVSKTGLFLLLSFVVNVKNKLDSNYTFTDNREDIDVLNVYRQNHLAFQFPVYDDNELRQQNKDVNYDGTIYNVPKRITTNNDILSQSIKDVSMLKPKPCARHVNYNDRFEPDIIRLKPNLKSVIKEWSMIEYLNDDDYRLQIAKERERELEMYYLKESSINILENPKFIEDGKLFGLQETYEETLKRQQKLEDLKKISIPQVKDVVNQMLNEKVPVRGTKVNYNGIVIPELYLVNALDEHLKEEENKKKSEEEEKKKKSA